MKAAWDRIVNGREHGLCELVDEPVHLQFKNEIVCELVEDEDT
jgi:hypothetical protein